MPETDATQNARPSRFNFSETGHLGPEQLRTLRTLQEQYSRNLTHTFGAWLRTAVTVTPLPELEQPYLRFSEDVAPQSHLLPLSMSGARAVLAIDLAIAPAIVDLLLGGSGRLQSGTPRELTEIEEAILGSALSVLLREWTSAWQPLGLHFAVASRDRESRHERILPLQERTVCCAFTLAIPSGSGRFIFCIPAANLSAALRDSTARRETRNIDADGECAAMVSRLRDVRVITSMHLPPVRLRTAEVAALAPGQLLPLPLSRATPAEFRASGMPAFLASPVQRGVRRAAQILPTQSEVLRDA